MKLTKSLIELDVYGQIISMRKPSYKEAQQYRSDLLKLDASEDASGLIQKFLLSLGLPEAIFNQLEMQHVSDILEEVTGSKKK